MSKDAIGILVRIPTKLHRDFKKALLDSCDDNGEVPSIKEVLIDMIEQYVEAANREKGQNKADSAKGG